MQRRSMNYPAELREHAVRRVGEVRAEYPSQWAAIEAVAVELGIGTAETVRKWVRRAEAEAEDSTGGAIARVQAEVRKLRRENDELRRRNAILIAASDFFGAVLDRPLSI